MNPWAILCLIALGIAAVCLLTVAIIAAAPYIAGGVVVLLIGRHIIKKLATPEPRKEE